MWLLPDIEHIIQIMLKKNTTSKKCANVGGGGNAQKVASKNCQT